MGERRAVEVSISRAWARRVACALALAVPSAGVAATYHVAPPPAGSDANPGTQAAPWATLQHAADTVGPGDTVLVHAGNFVGFHLSTSGTLAQPIVFRAATGEVAAITADNAQTPDGINLEGASYVTLEGFRVNGRTRAGIRAVLCRGVRIRGNLADQNGRWGIFTGCCEDLTIEDNEASRSGLEHGIYVSNSGDRPIVRGNYLWGNNANGLHMNGDLSVDCDGFVPTDGVISNALVEGNVISGNGVAGGSGINGDGVQSSLFRNNLIFDSHASGISLYQIDGGQPSTGNRVEHNTVVVASNGRWALNIQDGSSGNTVRNNTFWSDHGVRGAMNVCATCLAGFVSDRNAVEDRFTLDDGDSTLTLAQWRTATGQDASSFVATPAALFVAPASGDFHLRAGSPALDAGLPLADLGADLEGTPRPIGNGWDIGAYEGLTLLFADGFEPGATSRWSARRP